MNNWWMRTFCSATTVARPFLAVHVVGLETRVRLRDSGRIDRGLNMSLKCGCESLPPRPPKGKFHDCKPWRFRPHWVSHVRETRVRAKAI